MKALTWILAAAVGVVIWTSCQTADAKYIDLNTGHVVVLERDEESGEMINVATGEPVTLYVNSKSKDTIYGPSGKIVNNEIVRLDDMYVYSGDKDYKLKLEEGGYEEKYGDEYKVKSDADGDYKEKRGDENKVKFSRDGEYKRKRSDGNKIKRGDNGSYKVKRGDDYKKKVEEDGDVKIKQGNVKIEIDGETGERKVEVDD